MLCIDISELNIRSCCKISKDMQRSKQNLFSYNQEVIQLSVNIAHFLLISNLTIGLIE